VNRSYPPAEEQDRQRAVYEASLTAIANYLEGRDVLVRNRTLAQLDVLSQVNVVNNNNAPIDQADLGNEAVAQLRNAARTEVQPVGEITQAERALLFRAALQRSLEPIAENQKMQALNALAREALTQAIADIQNASAALQKVQASTSDWKIARIVDAGSEVAGKVPHLAGVVALIGHVAAMGRTILTDVGNSIGGFGPTGANIVGNLAGFMNTLANIIGQVPQVELVNGREVPVMQVDANGQPILDANGHQIPVMVPGPLRAGMASGIDLAKKADRLLTQNQATIILAALIPAGVVAGGTLWGASKLYKVFKHKPDFQPMREALVDIGHLLNEEGIAKDAGQAQLDQGKILYLVWKLKREAEHVPVLLRDQFQADVSKLSRSDLDTDKKRVWTADKKLQVIDLMYRTYDFLNPMYVVQ
jgi:hypothetical protein